MARPALATVADLERLLGASISGDELQDQALARLEQASEIVRAYAGQDWLDDAETALVDVPGAIPGVVAAMVERASRNPGGVTAETTGPFQRSFGPEAASRLYLTKAEQGVVRHATGANPTGLQVISTTRGPIETAPVFNCGSEGPSGFPAADDPYSLWGA